MEKISENTIVCNKSGISIRIDPESKILTILDYQKETIFITPDLNFTEFTLFIKNRLKEGTAISEIKLEISHIQSTAIKVYAYKRDFNHFSGEWFFSLYSSPTYFINDKRWFN